LQYQTRLTLTPPILLLGRDQQGISGVHEEEATSCPTDMMGGRRTRGDVTGWKRVRLP
jgi:hypothetical protein